MTDQSHKPLLLIDGLTPEQSHSLLYTLDEDPVKLETVGLPSTAFGDFGASALIFLASAAVVAGVLGWIGKQPGEVSLKLKFLGLIELSVDKSSSHKHVIEIVEKSGLILDPE